MHQDKELDYASYLVDQALGAIADAHNKLAHSLRIEPSLLRICAAAGPECNEVATEFSALVADQRKSLVAANEHLQQVKDAHQKLLTMRKK